MSKTPFLQKLFPLLGSAVGSRGFKIITGLVLAGTVGLLTAGVVTGDTLYFQLMGCLLFSALLGQIAPLYSVGVVSLFLFMMLVVLAHQPPTNVPANISPGYGVQPGVASTGANHTN